ncbi:MAG: hypothetical protein ACFE8G_13250 [Candidatus Hermodarchaeota archaeon]
MDNSGTIYFNHSFIAAWDQVENLRTWYQVINTINLSYEFFSKPTYRFQLGENTIQINKLSKNTVLMNSTKNVEPFLTCYIIKISSLNVLNAINPLQQSYPALQKLTRFTETIRENTEIWQALIKSVKTSEMIELDKLPALKRVIDEIF